MSEDHSLQLDRVLEGFEAWRKRRKPGERIPEELWKGAVGVAGSLGVSKTAQLLRLDHAHLKRRLAATAAGQAASQGPGSGSAFVELTPSPFAPVAECMLELEVPGGAKLRLHLKAKELPDVGALARSLVKSLP